MEPTVLFLLGTTEKRLAPSSLHLPFIYLLMWRTASLNFLFPRLNPSSSISLSSQERCSNHLILFMVLQRTPSGMSRSLLCLGAQNRTQHSGGASSVLQNGKDLLPCLAGNISPSMAQDTLSLCCKGTSVALDKLASTRTPGCFLQSFSPATWAPAYAAHGAVPLKVPGLSLLLVHLCRVLVSPFLQPVQNPEDGSTTL